MSGRKSHRESHWIKQVVTPASVEGLIPLKGHLIKEDRLGRFKGMKPFTAKVIYSSRDYGAFK